MELATSSGITAGAVFHLAGIANDQRFTVIAVTAGSAQVLVEDGKTIRGRWRTLRRKTQTYQVARLAAIVAGTR